MASFNNIQFNNSNLTLNQLVSIFENFAEGHQQIHRFGYGATYDINTVRSEKLPILWVIDQPVINNETYLGYTFQIWLLDLLEAGERNELEIKSDAIQILRDLVNVLKEVYDLDVEFGSSFNTFSDQFDAKLTGANITLTIDIPATWGSCDAPFNI